MNLPSQRPGGFVNGHCYTENLINQNGVIVTRYDYIPIMYPYIAKANNIIQGNTIVREEHEVETLLIGKTFNFPSDLTLQFAQHNSEPVGRSFENEYSFYNDSAKYTRNFKAGDKYTIIKNINEWESAFWIQLENGEKGVIAFYWHP